MFVYWFTYGFSLISEVLDSNNKQSHAFKIHYKNILAYLSTEKTMYIKKLHVVNWLI